MDREKAIQILKRCEAESHCEHYKRHYCCIGCDQREALDLAIEALKESQTTETQGERMTRIVHELSGCGAESATTTEVDYCNNCPYLPWGKDCISREGLLFALEPMMEDWEGMKTVKLIIETIPPIPPVNQKQVTGKLETAENATSEGEESTMGQPKSKLDCISREQAIEAVWSEYIDYEEHVAVDIERVLNALPSVIQTERTGKWIKSEIPNELYVCSECGGACWSYDYERNIVKSNYCPYCGAKMKGEK